MLSTDREALETYLNDHLSASVAALELMDRLAEEHGDSSLGRLVARFRQEVGEDQAMLESLIGALSGSESALGQAVAWVGEKVSRLKIGPGKDDLSGLKLLEALEALSVGFAGRNRLWRGLAHVHAQAPLPLALDYAVLAARAQRHIDELEPHRLDAGLAALTR